MARIQRNAGNTSAKRIDPSQFWEQAIHLYQENGIKQRLLTAQDTHGENVNLGLLIIYLERQGCALNEREKKHLADAVESFNAAHTSPLRALRRQLSVSESLPEKSREALKHTLLSAELIVEREEQRLLIEALNELRHYN